MSGLLSGLARGLAVTLRTMTRPAVTAEYPDRAPELPPRTRGVIALLEENCTVCMLCARECPDWCIYIDSHKESVQVEGAARARQRNVLDRFAIDFGLCMYCGICIEVCPFDALFWSPQFEYSATELGSLTHELDQLREWMWTVPPPPPLDPGAPQPKELAAPTRPARPAGGAARATADDTGVRPRRATADGTGERPRRTTTDDAERPRKATADGTGERPRRATAERAAASPAEPAAPGSAPAEPTEDDS